MARVGHPILQKDYVASCNSGKCNDFHFEQQFDDVHIVDTQDDVDVIHVQSYLVG